MNLTATVRVQCPSRRQRSEVPIPRTLGACSLSPISGDLDRLVVCLDWARSWSPQGCD